MDIAKFSCNEPFTVISKEVGENPEIVRQKNGMQLELDSADLQFTVHEERRESFQCLGTACLFGLCTVSKGEIQAQQVS